MNKKSFETLCPPEEIAGGVIFPAMFNDGVRCAVAVVLSATHFCSELSATINCFMECVRTENEKVSPGIPGFLVKRSRKSRV